MNNFEKPTQWWIFHASGAVSGPFPKEEAEHLLKEGDTLHPQYSSGISDKEKERQRKEILSMIART